MTVVSRELSLTTVSCFIGAHLPGVTESPRKSFWNGAVLSAWKTHVLKVEGFGV